MAFKLGNFAVKEIIRAVALDFDDKLLYTIDQLSSASIEVTAESTDITDKLGNVIRTIYNSKSATLSGTLALLSPAGINAASGSELTEAGASAAITMPAVKAIPAGSIINVADAKSGTIKVMGIYNNGANGITLTQGTSADYDAGEFGLDGDLLSVPAADAENGHPDSYLIVYDRDVESGIKLVNYANKFPSAVKLIMYAAIMDPCSSNYRAAYIVAPNAQADPAMTINLSADATETDINYNLNTDYCGCDRVLYYIYFPDEDAVTTVSCDVINDTPEPTPTPTPTPSPTPTETPTPSPTE